MLCIRSIKQGTYSRQGNTSEQERTDARKRTPDLDDICEGRSISINNQGLPKPPHPIPAEQDCTLHQNTKQGVSRGGKINLYWSVSEPLLVNAPTTTGQKTNHYWFAHGPIVVHTTHLRGTLSYSSTGAPHPPTTKRDTPPTQTKNTAKRQPSCESWRLAVFGWSGAIARYQ